MLVLLGVDCPSNWLMFACRSKRCRADLQIRLFLFWFFVVAVAVVLGVFFFGEGGANIPTASADSAALKLTNSKN